jgi:hypothetical protein
MGKDLSGKLSMMEVVEMDLEKPQGKIKHEETETNWRPKKDFLEIVQKFVKEKICLEKEKSEPTGK